MLKKMLMCFCLFAYMLGVSAGTDGVVEDNKKGDVAVKNLTRAMTLLDNTIDKCFKGSCVTSTILATGDRKARLTCGLTQLPWKR
jgi:hypothetical protein